MAIVDYTRSSLDPKPDASKANETPASDVKPVASAIKGDAPKSLKLKRMIGETAKSLNNDLVKPTIKKLVYDAIITTAGKALKIGPAATSNLVNNVWGATRYSYNTVYNNPTAATQNTVGNQATVGTNFDLEMIQFATQMEADDVLAMLDAVMEAKGRVTVADVYSASGLACDYTYAYYGWIGSLRNARVRMLTPDRYYLLLPKPMPLPK